MPATETMRRLESIQSVKWQEPDGAWVVGAELDLPLDTYTTEPPDRRVLVRLASTGRLVLVKRKYLEPLPDRTD